ncbi:MAG: element excision factor XisH family protein [Prochloraceae cyanobacterium]|nr:element excision factor XisH family protein [Prochloraceae cyanobacterium]
MLAVPSDTYDSFFKLQFIQLSIQQYQLKIIVSNSIEEVIVKWQK